MQIEISSSIHADDNKTLLALRRVFCLLFFAAALIAAVGAVGSSSGNQGVSSSLKATVNQKIAPWVIEHTGNGQKAEFFIVLVDQADLSRAASFKTKTEKGLYVYGSLLTKAEVTQRPILEWLRERRIEHRSFYIVNAILVKGSREIADALAARPEVARVEGNPLIKNYLPQPDRSTETPLLLQRPSTIEQGIVYTHAPDVWALGYTGQNIVIGSEDTGVRWTHNALKPHYRGWDGQTADHNYNWHDSIHDDVSNPCGNDSPFPCDDLGHGTHTTGIAVGDDGMGNQIGMAPGAKWIGCRALGQDHGSPARYIECMEWFIAPYPIGGGQGDPSKAPDITINSWYCDPPEGCSTDTLRAAVEAQVAAGIMTVVAAQNFGPNCSTVGYPPGIYDAAYSIGALVTGTDDIGFFSSRGPVTVDGSNRTKPDITAPGTGTRSCFNTSDDSYAVLSGTSMATPHISGATALLWSAVPNLKNQIGESRAALNNAAVHIDSTQCGDAGPPNNVYGWGRLDILAAVQAGLTCPNPWELVADMPVDVLGAAAASDGRYSYHAGGVSVSQGFIPLDVFNRYDWVSNTWTSLAHLPQPSVGAAAVFYPDPVAPKIYLFGGGDGFGTVYDITGIYDIYSDSWSIGPPMPDVRWVLASGYNPVNNRIYLVSGANGCCAEDAQPDTWEYDPVAGTFTSKAPFPHPASGFASGMINGKLYVAGGRDANNLIINLTWEYDPNADTWTPKADMPTSQNSTPGSAVALDRLWVFGGGDPYAVGTGSSSSIVPRLFVKADGRLPTTSSSTTVYDPFSDTWSSAPAMNVARSFVSGTAINTKLIAAGGFDGSASFASAERNDVCVPQGSPTPTATATATPTVTPTATATATPRPSPAPRPRPTPAPRP